MTDERSELPEIIIDSALTPEQAIVQNPEFPAPQWVLDEQRLLTVQYYSFDDMLHQGQIVVNEQVEEDVEELFGKIKKIKFPIGKVVPAVSYGFDDEALGRDNVTSGFNYRTIAKMKRISNHSYGFAIDFNTGINPYIRDDYEQVPGLVYDPNALGAIVKHGPMYKSFIQKGWDWGGDWPEGNKDWQHFEKPSKEKRYAR